MRSFGPAAFLLFVYRWIGKVPNHCKISVNDEKIITIHLGLSLCGSLTIQGDLYSQTCITTINKD